MKADPQASLCGLRAEDGELATADAGPPEPLTRRHAVVIGLVFFTYALLAFSIVPWGAILGRVGRPRHGDDDPFAAVVGALLVVAAAFALFFVMATVVGLVARLGEEAIAKAFSRAWPISPPRPFS